MRDVFTHPIRFTRTRLFGLSMIVMAALLLAPIIAIRADNYETLDQSFEFKTGGTVKIEGGSGVVKIEVWAEELVHVSAKKVEPAGHAVALSDLAFFNTKTQLTIKSQPTEPTIKIDMVVYVPRNTNLRITTTGGDVKVRGSVSSAMIETKTGNIVLEAPTSQNADVVFTTTTGKIRSTMPVEPYGTPTTKSLQGKLGSGGNPVIARTGSGNIQLAALEREVDQDVATIPSAPAPSSNSDSSGNYQGYGNSNDDNIFGNVDPNDARVKPRPNRNSQPYNYGGNYGGGSSQPDPDPDTAGGGSSRPSRANTDVFGGGRDTDESNSTVDLNGPGRGSVKNDTDNKGSFGVRIIPPPLGAPTANDSDDVIYHDSPGRNSQPQQRRSTPPDKLRTRGNNSGSQYDQPAPLQPRRSTPPDQIKKNDNTGNDDTDSNTRSGNTDLDKSSVNYPDDNEDTGTSNRGTIDRDQPLLRRGTQKGDDQNSGSRPGTKQTSSGDDEGTIKIDTKLVTLNVSALDRSGRAMTNLKTDNFKVFEDGVEQQVSHFESVNTPFNLVLLIDLSGSIIEKIDILRRAAIRFIEVTRPEDKVAVVAFTRSVFVVSDFTSDRVQLRQRLQYMHAPKGGTAFYEALWFTTTQLLKNVDGERNAIVLLSDGVDNAISMTYPIPSRVNFEQVLRKVQETSALVFPIYLDTEYENVEQEIETSESYVLARRQLSTLAEASGGVYIRAERVENLEGVYEKIAADLRTLYSIGYYPTNSNRDGSWRKIRVKLDKADVAVRTRRGYYAK
jgi:VWFA-related protein